MNLFDRLRLGFKKFTLRFSRSTGRWGWGLGSTDYDYESASRPNTNAMVMACVKWACRTFPEAPAGVEARRGKDWEPLDEHPLLALLDRPNPFYSGLHLWAATLADWMLTGNAYWLKRRSAGNRVVELWWFPSSSLEPKWPDDGQTYISHYDMTVEGQVYPLDPADVVHFRNGFDPSNIRKGLSDLAALYREIATDNEAANWTASMLRNAGVPSIIISPDGESELNEDDAEDMKEKFVARSGGDQRGRPMVMTAKMKVATLSFTPEQMQLRDLRRVPEERVSAVFGIPAVVVGLGAGLDKATYSNVGQAREAAYESFLIPTQRLLSAELNTQLVPDFGDSTRLRVAFDLSKVRVLQDDQNALHERARTDLLAGLLTLNGALQMIGETPLPGKDGEVRYIPSNVKPTVADDLLPAPVPAALLPGTMPPALPPGDQTPPPAEQAPPPPKALSKSGAPLPPVAEVVLGPDDARRALALFDLTFPEYAGLLDAQVVGSTNGHARH